MSAAAFLARRNNFVVVRTTAVLQFNFAPVRNTFESLEA